MTKLYTLEYIRLRFLYSYFFIIHLGNYNETLCVILRDKVRLFQSHKVLFQEDLIHLYYRKHNL